MPRSGEIHTSPARVGLFSIAGIALVCLALVYGCNYYWIHKTPRQSCVSFSAFGAGTGMTREGSLYSIYNFDCGDGITVTFSSQRFSSPATADQELQRAKKLAARVLEETPTLDSQGNRVGTRLVLHRAWGPIFLAQMVVWTEGSSLNVMYSRCPRFLEAFEKWYARQPQ